jgi:DNA (cytosine-5)-methyltransferase 1
MVNDRTNNGTAVGNSDMKDGNNAAVAAEGSYQAISEEIRNAPQIERDTGVDVVGSSEVAGTLTASRGTGFRSNGTPIEGVAITPMGPRRFTPRECERLMGYPDGYTAITYRNKPACDTPRFHALGNSIVVPILHCLGRRIAKAFTTNSLTELAARPTPRMQDDRTVDP